MLTIQFKVSAFQSKDYAGWNIEAVECAFIHNPIGDMSHFFGPFESPTLWRSKARMRKTMRLCGADS